MDFATICNKFEVHKIAEKLRPLTALPSLKSVRLPNSFSKLKTLQIFQRDDTKKESVEHGTKNLKKDTQLLSVLPPDFINYTPSRISTISSLTLENDNKYDNASLSYRSAETVDDNYAISTQPGIIGTISPKCVSKDSEYYDSSTAAIIRTASQQSFTQKLHKQYTDFSDFKLKHILSKKTVVRKDNIEVEQYVESFKREIAIEKEEFKRQDIEIGDDYCIQFSDCKPMDMANTVETKTINEEKNPRNVINISPLKRKQENSSSRFSKVVHPDQIMPLEFEKSIAHDFIKKEIVSHDTIKSVVQKHPNDGSTRCGKMQKFKKKLKQLHARDNICHIYNSSNVDIKTIINEKIQIWKNSLKRTNVTNCEYDIKNVNNFVNREKHLPALKKSKKHIIKQGVGDNADSPMQKHNRSETLMRKLKYIRARKSSNSIEDNEEDGVSVETSTCHCDGTPKLTVEKLTNAIDPLAIVQNEITNSDPQISNKSDLGTYNRSPLSTVSLSSSEVNHYNHERNANMEDGYGCMNEYAARNCTKWTNNSILNESIESYDKNCDYPQVLIHQDNSDFFESTLVISVTHPATSTPSPNVKKKCFQNAKENNKPQQNFRCASNELITDETELPELSHRRINFENKLENFSVSKILTSANLKMRTCSAADINESNGNTNERRQLLKCRSIDIFHANNMSISTAFDNFDEELCNEPILKISPITDITRDNDNNNEESSSKKLKQFCCSNENITLTNEFGKSNMEKIIQFGHNEDNLSTWVNECLDRGSIDNDHVAEDQCNRSPPEILSTSQIQISALLVPSPKQNANRITSIQKGTDCIGKKKGSMSLPAIRPTLGQYKMTRCTSFHKPAESQKIRFENRCVKPLVRTSSLNVPFEQFKVTDIGKVNQLISHFEQPVERTQSLHKQNKKSSILFASKTTTTETKNNDYNKLESYLNLQINNVTNNNKIREEKNYRYNNARNWDANSNYNHSDSEYNNSFAVSSKLYFSPNVTPTNIKPNRLRVEEINNNRKQRGFMKDPDNYYSFDSDEENSYYSLSSSNSSRNVVEI